MGISSRIRFHKGRLGEFCRRNHIRRPAVFGSVLRADLSGGSDVDMLVEFVPGHPVGLIRLAAMELELTEIVGWKVDMRTPADLSRYFRQEVMESAQVQYEA